MAERRSEQWWTKAIRRWRRSQLTAREFAEREGIALSTLYWWSSKVSRATRAERESAKPVPLEVRVEAAPQMGPAVSIEVVFGEAVVRVPTGTDPAYVAALVRALGTPT